MTRNFTLYIKDMLQNMQDAQEIISEMICANILPFRGRNAWNERQSVSFLFWSELGGCLDRFKGSNSSH